MSKVNNNELPYNAKPILVTDHDEAVKNLPSAEDLDKVAEEEKIKEETETPEHCFETTKFAPQELTDKAYTGAVISPLGRPELFENLKVVLTGPDIEYSQKVNAVRSLLHNHKNGNELFSNHAASLLHELLLR